MKQISVKSLSAIILAFIFLNFSIKITNTDFSGKWKLNESKSELGDFGARLAAKGITIIQNDNSITVAKEVTTFNGDNVTRTETLTFDGKEVETSMGFGNSKRKASAKWSADGKELVITYTLYFDFNGQSNEIPGKETYTKSDDGKTFSLKTESSSPQGDISIIAVYDKQ